MTFLMMMVDPCCDCLSHYRHYHHAHTQPVYALPVDSCPLTHLPCPCVNTYRQPQVMSNLPLGPPTTTQPHAAFKAAKVHRTARVGDVTISVIEADISSATTEAVVNAANSLSFMPMDGGVSGALRNACRYDSV